MWKGGDPTCFDFEKHRLDLLAGTAKERRAFLKSPPAATGGAAAAARRTTACRGQASQGGAAKRSRPQRGSLLAVQTSGEVHLLQTHPQQGLPAPVQGWLRCRCGSGPAKPALRSPWL